MSTVAGGSTSVDGWVRRRAEFPDVFAVGGLRPEVVGLLAAAERGVLLLGWVSELFTERADHLVNGVRALDRAALREAFVLSWVEEPAVRRAFELSLSDGAVPVHVADAVGEVIGALTRLGELAAAWEWFVHGDDTDGSE